MLTIDDVVKVVLTLGSPVIASSTFKVGLILGASDVISASDRVATYTNVEEMITAGFTTSQDEYKAAALYFGSDPSPAKVLVGRIAANEAPLDALKAVMVKTGDFDSVFVTGSSTAAQLKAIVDYIDSLNHLHLWYTVTGTAASAVSVDSTFSILKATESRRCCGVFSADANAGAAAMGALLGKLYAYPDTAVQACYSTLTGVQVSDLTQTEVDAIKAAGGNVYISRYNSKGLFENGQTANGLRIDDSIYLDMLASDMQIACYNLITDQASRLPQSDDTSTMFINAVSGVLNGYSTRHIIGSGIWNGRSFGNVNQGDVLTDGYAIYVDSYDHQSAEDRAAHKAMPIIIAIILGGSVESVEIDLYGQR